jgi:hypothetical protein
VKVMLTVPEGVPATAPLNWMICGTADDAGELGALLCCAVTGAGSAARIRSAATKIRTRTA